VCLVVFDNAGALTNIRYGAAGGSNQLVPVNQATFLGTFATSPTNGPGILHIRLKRLLAEAAATFFLCNYYNKILQTTIVTDTGASYTYNSTTVRQARASGGNNIQFIQSDSERANRSRLQQGLSDGCVWREQPCHRHRRWCDQCLQCSQPLRGSDGLCRHRQPASVPYQFSIPDWLTSCRRSDGRLCLYFRHQTTNQLMASIWL